MKRYKIVQIYISELGYLMVKVLDKERSHFTSHNLGPVKDAIDLSKLNIDISLIELYEYKRR